MDKIDRTAKGEFDMLDGIRQPMMDRFERLSQLTIPSVLPDHDYDQVQDQLTNGFSSLGSQCVTHLTNKLMNAMFAPSRPFFRLSLSNDALQELIQKLNADEGTITDALAQGERDSMAELEREGCREALYEGMTHLVALGNVLMDMSGDTLVFTGIRDYVVRRNAKGVMTMLIIREKCRYDDLEADVQAQYANHETCDDDREVCTYKWVRLQKGMYHESFWVEDLRLGPEYDGKYKIENVPYRALTWRLPLRQHYGVGRAEEYANDLAVFDQMAEATSDGAVLASQFKWVCNPGGITRPEDLTMTENGAVVPGQKEDVDLIYANIGQQLATVMGLANEYKQRLGAGFLLSSAVTRQAERVTAEEIRMQVMELESSLGGVYSRLSLSIQGPLANWLMRKAQVNIKGTQIRPVVVTGLDALSRNGDLERMRAFLSDAAALDQLNPQGVANILNKDNILSDMAAGNGVEKGRYILTQAQQQANQAAMQQQALQQQAAANTVDANTIPEDQQ